MMLADQRPSQARKPPPGFENVIPRQSKHHDANKDPSSPSKPCHQHILLPPHLQHGIGSTQQAGSAASSLQSNATVTFPPDPYSAACLPVTASNATDTCSLRGTGQTFISSNNAAVATSTGSVSTGGGLSDLLAKHRAAATQRISGETGFHPQPAHYLLSLQRASASQPSLNMPQVAHTGMQHLHTIHELPLSNQATPPTAVLAPGAVQAYANPAEPDSVWQVGAASMPHQSSHPWSHNLPYTRPGPAPSPMMGPDLAPCGSHAPPDPATWPCMGQAPTRGTAAQPGPDFSDTSGGGGGDGYAGGLYRSQPTPSGAGWTHTMASTALPPPMSRAAAAAAAGSWAPAESVPPGTHQTVQHTMAAHHVHAGAVHTQLAASAACKPCPPGQHQTAAATAAFTEHVQDAAKPCPSQHMPDRQPSGDPHWAHKSHAHAEVILRRIKPCEPVLELAAQRRYLFASTPVCFQCGHAGHEGTECVTDYCEACDLFGHVSGQCMYACTLCGDQHDPPLGRNCNQPRCSTCRLWGHTNDTCPSQQCKHCQWYGHTNQDCPGYCRYCHKPGHQTDDCPVYRCSLCRNQGHKWQNCPLHLQEGSAHTFQLPWQVQAGVQQDAWDDQDQQQEQRCSDTIAGKQMPDTLRSSKPWRDSDHAAECKGKGAARPRIGLSRLAQGSE